MTHHLYLSESKIQGAGKGLFTLVPLQKGEILGEYVGLRYKEKELHNLPLSQRDFAIKYEDYAFETSNGTTICPYEDCVFRYANDIVDFGFIIQHYKDTRKYQHLEIPELNYNIDWTVDDDDRVWIVASRDIEPDEELYIYYGKQYWRYQLKKYIKKNPLPLKRRCNRTIKYRQLKITHYFVDCCD